MAVTTSYILEKIKLEGVLHDVLAKTNGDNTTVTYAGKSQTLTSALASIMTSMSALPTTDNVDTKISAAISELIGGAPETYDTLKEIADYIETHQDTVDLLNEAIGKKVDKVEGKGLSTEDFTTELKTALEALADLGLTAEKVAAWDAKAEATEATTEKAGLMSAADKTKLDGLNGVRYGTEVPADMQNGEMFVRIVSTGEEEETPSA